MTCAIEGWREERDVSGATAGAGAGAAAPASTGSGADEDAGVSAAAEAAAGAAALVVEASLLSEAGRVPEVESGDGLSLWTLSTVKLLDASAPRGQSKILSGAGPGVTNTGRQASIYQVDRKAFVAPARVPRRIIDLDRSVLNSVLHTGYGGCRARCNTGVAASGGGEGGMK
jgi:hypothetical protein